MRHCQGQALADWAAHGADGKSLGEGTTVFALDPEGRIWAATGFWQRAASSG